MLVAPRSVCTASFVPLLNSDAEMTFPWDVPPETIVVEFIDGVWRVVPHKGAIETFSSRDQALARARQIAFRYLDPWRIVERPKRGARRPA